MLYPSDIAILIVFTYLWLPYMILPIYAGLERIPASLLEASGPTSAADRGTTFRRVISPAGVAGRRRGLDLHVLADARRLHHARRSCRTASSSATSIYDNQGVAGNVPFAAAYAIVPVMIMAVYLFIARRLGAFEAL